MSQRTDRPGQGAQKTLKFKDKSRASGLRRQPVQSRSQSTLAALHEAMAQVLAQHGEAGLTTQAIADRAGVSIGTFYQYFSDRDALLAHGLNAEREAVNQALTAGLTTALCEGQPLAQAVIQAIDLLVSRLGGDTPARRTLLRLAWQADSHQAWVPALQHAAERNTALMSQQAERPSMPDALGMYVAIRAVMGVIRAAALESSPWLGTPALRQHLVAMVLALLQPAAAESTGSVVRQGGNQVDGLGLPGAGAQGQAA